MLARWREWEEKPGERRGNLNGIPKKTKFNLLSKMDGREKRKDADQGRRNGRGHCLDACINRQGPRC